MPNGASMLAVTCVFHDSNPRSHVRKSFGPLSHNFLCCDIRFSHISVLGILFYFANMITED